MQRVKKYIPYYSYRFVDLSKVLLYLKNNYIEYSLNIILVLASVFECSYFFK